MKVAIRRLGELGADLVLAPERWVAADDIGDGTPLNDLVVGRRERSLAGDALVLDTTHARDGVIDIAAALHAGTQAKSAKKLACAGDVLVSRLRPYLRQIAFVHPRAVEAMDRRPIAVSTEFYVLAPRRAKDDDLAFLVPFLLGTRTQAILVAAQEGGHHPRVPRSSLLALRVPEALLTRRKPIARDVHRALDALYASAGRSRETLREVDATVTDAR